jgi:hypothetical protein
MMSCDRATHYRYPTEDVQSEKRRRTDQGKNRPLAQITGTERRRKVHTVPIHHHNQQ